MTLAVTDSVRMKQSIAASPPLAACASTLKFCRHGTIHAVPTYYYSQTAQQFQLFRKCKMEKITTAPPVEPDVICQIEDFTNLMNNILQVPKAEIDASLAEKKEKRTSAKSKGTRE